MPKPPDSAKPMPTVADTSESVVSSLSRMRDELDRGVEARAVAEREQLLRVGAPTRAAHLRRDPHVEVEDAVVGVDVPVAPVSGRVPHGGVQDVHRCLRSAEGRAQRWQRARPVTPCAGRGRPGGDAARCDGQAASRTAIEQRDRRDQDEGEQREGSDVEHGRALGHRAPQRPTQRDAEGHADHHADQREDDRLRQRDGRASASA